MKSNEYSYPLYENSTGKNGQTMVKRYESEANFWHPLAKPEETQQNDCSFMGRPEVHLVYSIKC